MSGLYEKNNVQYTDSLSNSVIFFLTFSSNYTVNCTLSVAFFSCKATTIDCLFKSLVNFHNIVVNQKDCFTFN